MASEDKVTIATSGGDYTSLAGWEAGEDDTGDLVSRDVYHVAEITGTWAEADTTAVTIDGWTTDATRYIEIRAVGAARHAGKWSTTAHRLVADTSVFVSAENDVHLIGVQVECNYSGESNRIGIGFIGVVRTLVDSCIVRWTGTTTGAADGIYLTNTSNGTIRNCLAYDWKTNNLRTPGDGTTYVDNCTAVGGGFGYYCNYNGTRFRNCISQGCTDGWSVSALAASTNNHCDAAGGGDAPGSNPRTGTVAFVDADNDDYHLLTSDTVAYGYGVDLSADFTTDIDGDTRTVWSIGADDGTAAGGEALTGSFSDELSLGESRAASAAFAAAAVDGLSMGDSSSPAAGYVAALADAIALGDASGAAAQLAAQAIDALTLADATARTAALAAAHAEAVVLSEIFGGQAAFVQAFADALDLGEAFDGIIGGAQLTAAIEDAIALGDASGAVALFAAAFADAITLGESRAAAAFFRALLADGLSIADALTASAHFVAATSDAIALGDLARLPWETIPHLRATITDLRLRGTITDLRLRGSIEPA